MIGLSGGADVLIPEDSNAFLRGISRDSHLQASNPLRRHRMLGQGKQKSSLANVISFLFAHQVGQQVHKPSIYKPSIHKPSIHKPSIHKAGIHFG